MDGPDESGDENTRELGALITGNKRRDDSRGEMHPISANSLPESISFLLQRASCCVMLETPFVVTHTQTHI